jgi:RHS repeat-associated protein
MFSVLASTRRVSKSLVNVLVWACRIVIAASVLSFTAPAWAGGAHLEAQAPMLSYDTPSGTHFSTQTVEISFRFCSQYDLTSATSYFHSGTPVAWGSEAATACYYTYSRRIFKTVTLSVGMNSITIEVYDHLGQYTNLTGNYYYDGGPAPTVAAPATQSTILSTSGTAAFTVTNNGNASDNFGFQATCTVVTCNSSLSPYNATIAAHSSITVSVPYSTTVLGSGSITLAANSTAYAPGSGVASISVVSAPTPTVTFINPTGTHFSVQQQILPIRVCLGVAGGMPTTSVFGIANLMFNVGASTGCPAGWYAYVVNVYGTLSPGANELYIAAYDNNYGSSGYIHATYYYDPPSAPAITPPASMQLGEGQERTLTFTVISTSTAGATYDIVRSCTVVTCGPVFPASVYIAGGTTRDAIVTVTSYQPGSGSVTLTATPVGGSGTTVSSSVTVNPPWKRWKIVPNAAPAYMVPGATTTVHFAIVDTGSGTPVLGRVRPKCSAPNAPSPPDYCYFGDSDDPSSETWGVPSSIDVHVLSNATVGANDKIWLIYDLGSYDAAMNLHWTPGDSAYAIVTSVPGYGVSVSPHDSTITKREPNTLQSESFVVTNTGFNSWRGISLNATCGTFTQCKPSSDTINLVTGASQTVTVSYRTGTTVPATNAVKLVASSLEVGNGVYYSMAKDSGTKHVTVNETIPPIVTVIPRLDSLVRTRAFNAVVTVCDSDGVVQVPHAFFNGVSLPPTFSATSVAGCRSAQRATYSLFGQAEANALRVTTSDGYHAVDSTTTFIYDPAWEHKPIVTADVPAALVAALQARTDTFRIKNPGTYNVTYQIGTNCLALGLTCTTAPSATIAPGATGPVVVSYVAPTTGTSLPLRFYAVYSGSHTTLLDSATTLISIGGGAPPQIALTPTDGSSVPSSTTTIVATWCDPDDALTSRLLAVNGQTLADTYVAQTRAGCASAGTSIWTGVPLVPGPNSIAAQATDAAGHRVSATSIVAYAASLASFAPAVTPKGSSVLLKRGVPASTLFTVTNAGTFAATYSYSATCGTLADCAMSTTRGTLAPGAHDTVRVWYSVPSTFGIHSNLTFVASATPWAGQSIADTAVVALSTPTVAMSYQPRLSPTSGSYTGFPGWYAGIPLYITNMGSDTATYSYSITSPSSAVIPYGSNPDTPFAVAPGQTVWMVVNARGDAIGHTDPVYVTFSAGYGGDSVRVSGTYMMGNYPPVFGFALSHPPANKVDSRSASAHEIPYQITPTGVNYGDTIRVHVRCDGVVMNCVGNVSNAADQEHLLYFDTVSASAVYQLRDTGVVGHLWIVAASAKNGALRDSVQVMITTSSTYASVAVTPSAMRLSVPIGLHPRQRFTVTNQGTSADAFTYITTCDPVLQCVSPPTGTTAQLAIGGSDSSIVVTYRVPTAVGDSGKITVLARSVRDTSATSIGILTIVGSTAPPMTVATSTVNAGPHVDRNACLSIAAGPDAAYECGDLRLTYSMPAVRTMNKSRAPALTFISNHVEAVALIAANVTVAPGAIPAGITATVVAKNLGDTTVVHSAVTRTFAWDPNWSDGAPRRIVVPVSADAAALTTGAYRYTLEVKPSDSTSSLAAVSDTGTFVIVNRRASPFGAGWWVDGLEDLSTPVGTNRRLLISGDGTVRLYTYSGLTAAGTRAYVATPQLDHPDSLIETGGGAMVRRLANGAYVQFNGAGQHTATVNEQGHTTTFGYTGALMTSIAVPTPGTPLSYSFVYAADVNNVQRLAWVTPPSINGVARTVQMGRSAGWVTHFYEPDGHKIDFAYDTPPSSLATGRHRIVSRVNRFGDTTSFSYDAAGLLRTSSQDMRRTNGPTAAPIVRGFCAAESRSIAHCAASDSTELQPQPLKKVYSWYDGPRTDVADTTIFYIGRYSTPDTIIDALGRATKIERDAHWPLLASAATAPNGHRTEVAYNARGLDSVAIDRNPLGNGQDAYTAYTWHPKWNLPTSIVGPLGERTDILYDTSWPNRVWQQDGRGDTSRVTFTYGANNQVAYIQLPGATALAQKERLEYDANLGNLYRRTSPLGIATTYHVDQVGRVDETYTSLDATHQRVQYTAFDLLDRDTLVTTTGPRGYRDVSGQQSYASSASESISVRKYFNLTGSLDSLTHRQSPNPIGIAPLTTRWTYDAAGRKLSEVAPDLKVEHYVYGDGMNLTASTNRNGEVVTVRYDALNRLVANVLPAKSITTSILGTSTVPAQTDSFAYDVAGRMTGAFNQFSKVRRDYYPNGSLKSELQSVASASGSFGQHDYTTQYTYDLSGRRAHLAYPIQFDVGSAANGAGSVDYGYDVAGRLHTVQSHGGQLFTYDYDDRSRRTRLTLPNGIVDRRAYDDDDRMIGMVQLAQPGVTGWYHGGDTIRVDSITRDYLGRAINVSSYTAANATMVYNALGPLHEYHRYGGLTTATDEVYTVDAMGNRTFTDRNNTSTGEEHQYALATGRLSAIAQHNDASAPSLVPSYDSGGNQTLMVRAHMTAGLSGGTVMAATNTQNAYDALGRLRLVRERPVSGGNPGSVAAENQFADEETRYDALGRRVWLLSAHLDTNSIGTGDVCSLYCSVTRFVWDGDQLLGEIRMPRERQENDLSPIFDWRLVCDSTSGGAGAGCTTPIVGSDSVQVYSWRWGRTIYTHGPGIDAPIGITRADGGFSTTLMDPFTMYPLEDWRGNLAKMSFGNGDSKLSSVAGASPPLLDDQEELPAFRQRVATSWAVLSWVGSLATGQVGETGLEYRRNRYYDPEQGRFTQEDPIGLAGGMNLYGFGGGDPVNYADPFGLCPSCIEGQMARLTDQQVPFYYRESFRQDLMYSVMGATSELRVALEGAEEVRQVGEAAHHIVAQGSARAAPAREILRKAGIGIHEAVNGVFLPALKGHSGPEANHLTLHTKDYFNWVNETLQGLSTREDVTAALGIIKEKLLKW